MTSSAWLISMASLMPPVLVLSVAVVGVRAFAIGRSVFRYSERLVSHDVAFRMLGQTRLEVFQELNLDKLFRNNQFKYGDVYQRITADVEQVQDGWLRIILPFFSAITSGLFGFIVLFWLAPTAGLVFLVLFGIMLGIIPFTVSRFTNVTEQVSATAKANLVTETLRTYESVEEIAIFGGAKGQIERLTQTDDRVNQIGLRRARFDGLGNSLSVLMTGLSITLMILIAYEAFSQNELAGVNVAVLVLLPIAALEAIMLLPLAGILITRVKMSQKRVKQLTKKNEPFQSKELPDTTTLSLIEYSATWQNEIEAKSVNATIDSGEVLLVSGPSGSGKTSLALGLVNLLEYQGSAKIGNVELRELAESQLSQLICLATQDAKIFNTTLRENLLIARNTATDSELQELLKIVGLDISNWQAGLDTNIGYGGRTISGGERNRVSIARALLSPARILVLDEPTEYLDPKAAKALVDEVVSSTVDRSLIIITHEKLNIANRVSKELRL